MSNKKIRILYIIPSLASGGAEKFVLDLISSLDQNIFEAKLLTFNGGGFFEELARNRKINLEILRKRTKLDLINFYLVYKSIKNFKADIVHTSLGGDVYGKMAAKLAGVKSIISTEQNVLENDNSVIRFLKSTTAKFSKKIIAISSQVKTDIIKAYGVSEEKVVLIPNGVNSLDFNIEKKEKHEKQIVFGSIGRLSEQKNYSLLIKALADFKNENFSCLIVGEGNLRSDLEKEIFNFGLEDKIKLIGTSKNVAEFLSGLDFFVLPSKWEGLGIVLLEAGLAKLPVLASATGGILDIIKDKETGILFENNNLNDLKNKLSYFFDKNNKENLTVFGSNLYDFIIDNFDIKIIAKKYSNLYLSLF